MTLHRLLLLLATALLLTWGSAAGADVLTTSEGLTLEGEVERLPNGWYRVTTAKGTVDLAPSAVADVREGQGPRAAFLAEASGVDVKDARAQYRLALKAEEAGLADLAAEAYRRVLAIEPDHLAARRALGHERLEGEWVTAATARRRKGLVLYGGRWRLPAEVESASARQAGTEEATAAADDARARALIRRLATGPAPVQHAARLALARTDDALVVRAALATLYDADPKVRIASCRLLARIGDEAALRPLILSGARDTDPGVRREAVLAAAAFGHDDTAIPYVRALGSKNPRLAGHAAEALALIGDQRAAGYIVKRLRSHGSSTRNYVSFMTQVSYVRDYDVEIAQASNIANPDVATISEGVILDVKVLDAAYTKTWVEPLLVKAFNDLSGQRLRSADEVRAWYAENRERLPDFPPKPNARAPRRVKGRMIGAH